MLELNKNVSSKMNEIAKKYLELSPDLSEFNHTHSFNCGLIHFDNMLIQYEYILHNDTYLITNSRDNIQITVESLEQLNFYIHLLVHNVFHKIIFD